MITIKELARELDVSYEAVRQQVKRYANRELDGHIFATGKVQYLDAFAAEFLKTKRNLSPVVVVQQDKDEATKALEDENKALLQKIAILQEDLLKSKESQFQLQGELSEQKLLAAKAEDAERRAIDARKKNLELEVALERAKIENEAAERRAAETEIALTDVRERLKTSEDVAELNAQEADKAKADAAAARSEAEDLRADLERLKKRSLWQRILNK